jgi:hypothetical protein
MKRLVLAAALVFSACGQETIKTVYVTADGGTLPSADQGTEKVKPLEDGGAATVDATVIADQSVTLDQGVSVDQDIPKPDSTVPVEDASVPPPPVDASAVPVPDGPPPECVRDQDCDDQISCTINLCLQGKCNYDTLAPGFCHIWGGCQKAGERQPGSELVCDPKDPINWTVPDMRWGWWAGDGRALFKDGPANTASFDTIYSMTVGPDGTLYVSTVRGSDYVIRTVKDGQVSLFAGGGAISGIEGHRLKVGFSSTIGSMVVTPDNTLYFLIFDKWWRIKNDQVTLVSNLDYIHYVGGNSAAPSARPDNSLTLLADEPFTGYNVSNWKNGITTKLPFQPTSTTGYSHFVHPPMDTCGLNLAYTGRPYNVYALYPDGTNRCVTGECGLKTAGPSVDGTSTTARFSSILHALHYAKNKKGGSMVVLDYNSIRLVGYCSGNVRTIWGCNSHYPETDTFCTPQEWNNFPTMMTADPKSGKIYFLDKDRHKIFATKPDSTELYSSYFY